MTAQKQPKSLSLEDLRRRATVSLPEAAALLGVSRPHMYVLAHRGEMPTLRLGNRWVVSAPLLLQMLLNPPTPDVSSEDLTA